MNTKIFALLTENLHRAFALEKYAQVRETLNEGTQVQNLPWTPVRFRKFKDAIEKELGFPCEFTGSVRELVEQFDRRYLSVFFGEIWKPRTGDYNYTGWQLADEIVKHDPKNVLDVGCGYNQFKERIPNLIGIDPYNNCADYMVDILDYKVPEGTHDHIIALGSINFNSKEDIEARFSHCVKLLQKGGRFYLRANPGIQWKNGPYVDIFAWSFEIVKEFELKYGLKLETYKQESTDPGRLYFVYTKL